MVDSLRSIQPFHTTLRYRGSTTWWYLNPDFGLQGDAQLLPSRATTTTLLAAHASTSESSECLEANVCRVGIPIHRMSYFLRLLVRPNSTSRHSVALTPVDKPGDDSLLGIC
jgi:hypothetical protein